jgi:hypothetical protein
MFRFTVMKLRRGISTSIHRNVGDSSGVAYSWKDRVPMQKEGIHNPIATAFERFLFLWEKMIKFRQRNGGVCIFPVPSVLPYIIWGIQTAILFHLHFENIKFLPKPTGTFVKK